MPKGKLIKFLNRPLIKGVLKSVPFVGDIMQNIEDDSFEHPTGHFNPVGMVPVIIRLLALIALAYFVLKGTITLEDAEGVKELIDAN